ncbi:3-carboxy-cis,cis-muconate cycloisomerase [Hoeflea halophila]|uniref:3-carboxy-cis,cis-muconate cycloisomerase n=1 Tax=Hoeflea halophila TaxID=714899 RepID=A0A286HMG8_9HYPH|nr:3-carboxy-cis,cis-muconate cycloisomerase [Hoeflea halophila]SOE09023.1 3-carboxy-cis,cis-muconate cycloisomerase [Hoeflea halophila]
MTAGGQSWTAGLFRDHEIAERFSDDALFASFSRFERALISGLAKAGLITREDAEDLIDQIADFEPDGAAIVEAGIRDGVPVPDYIRQLRAHVSGPAKGMLHHGATSQDLMDTATVEALVSVNGILGQRIETLLGQLSGLSARDGGNTLQAITRMQPAIPFQAADRIASWRRPLQSLYDRMPALSEKIGLLQLGGAVGDLQDLGDNAETVAGIMSGELGLRWPGQSWHTDRSPVLAQANWLSELTGALGKIGQDVALMALRGHDDIQLVGGGASSAMPHKQNPVTAERLVALARYNATLLAGMHHAQLHEMERSGAAWMLEWMILPQMCETAGVSLTAASALIDSIKEMGKTA